ncbi:MAG: hypothetical protein A3A27_02715 [Candidatus Wildermuthbacteria bacterium RIFCSPLOWO2_01_FULL_47_18]|uniref:DUF4382 domain-containing protein n=2 Tax=Candidatus Wildermuthiibacteriota TaxID=1817923 RepID=A0A1G2RGN7_9BACT|nr:MAG: hypothetical protein A3A27_02715 [Candidatus Wildermuthbacteria bacterium RIFCSPLOWO2_01_FULL_47_18]
MSSRAQDYGGNSVNDIDADIFISKGRVIRKKQYIQKSMSKVPAAVLVGALLIVVAGGLYAYFKGASNPENQQALKGNVIFGITDQAVSLSGIESIKATIDKVQAHQEGDGWLTVSEGPREFNLLDLKARGAIELLAQAQLPEREYNQIRPEISKVLITKANGQTQEAKLPSGDLKLVGKIVVQANKTSSIVVDFLADESLHVTGSGKFIFSPVVKLETRSNASVQVSGKDVAVAGGVVETDVNLGMDENGETKEGFALGAHAKLELMEDVIRIIPDGQSEAGISVSAQAATNIVKEGNHLDKVFSVTLIKVDGKKIWEVSGMKNVGLSNIFVDASTGAVIATE